MFGNCRERRSLMKPALLIASAILYLGATGIESSRPSFPMCPMGGSSDAELSPELKAFAALQPIDTHVHAWKDSPVFYATLVRLHLHVVNIAVVSSVDPPIYRTLEPQLLLLRTMHQDSRGRVAMCTTFDSYKFQSPNFGDDVIKQLNENFRNGAVAVKIYKNMGMELKWPSGKYVLPDDPVFEPIYQDIAAHNITVIAHLAEPDTSWESLEEIGPNNPDYGYYKKYPYWHMYGKPGAPSKAQILAARDHVLEENPQLRFIGAHLGSMETDVDEIAKRFDRYPNFAVDTAARVHYLTIQPREKVRAFLMKYQDRVVYGTDNDLQPEMDTTQRMELWKSRYTNDWKYFATDETFAYNGRSIRGLNLPPAVLRKLYHDNAVKWIPGVLGSSTPSQTQPQPFH
jgi:predicted TIM-barrel fold metal-dependent hydrolase